MPLDMINDIKINCSIRQLVLPQNTELSANTGSMLASLKRLRGNRLADDVVGVLQVITDHTSVMGSSHVMLRVISYSMEDQKLCFFLSSTWYKVRA